MSSCGAGYGQGSGTTFSSTSEFDWDLKDVSDAAGRQYLFDQATKVQGMHSLHARF